MTKPTSGSIMIPARISAQDLADAIGLEVEEVQVVLTSRRDPNAPGDLLDGRLAIDIAETLGFEVMIEARDLALECLYTFETRGELVDDPGGRAGHLATGVIDNIEQLDAKIESVSEHWSVARMPLVDRNILRIGLFELENDKDPATPVVVSEAVRLAQLYSTEKSGAFINGVLATLAKGVRDE
jgi:N utilization substance protein B